MGQRLADVEDIVEDMAKEVDGLAYFFLKYEEL